MSFCWRRALMAENPGTRWADRPSERVVLKFCISSHNMGAIPEQ